MISETHLIDCIEYMKRFEDNHFELAIVDPPYGINVNMNIGIKKGKRKKRTQKSWDENPPSEKYFNELKRVSKNQIIWGGNYFKQLGFYFPKWKRLQDFDYKNGIVWKKGLTMYGRDFNEAEWAYSTVGNGCFELSPVQMDRFHPTQKPVALYKWLLHNYAKKGDKILDTHLGSQSSRIAAYEMGFDFYGCELDPDYFRDGNKRFEAFKAKHNPLFTFDEFTSCTT
jgi:site-specific DNA-methyltransferase (adenine-specific)